MFLYYPMITSAKTLTASTKKKEKKNEDLDLCVNGLHKNSINTKEEPLSEMRKTFIMKRFEQKHRRIFTVIVKLVVPLPSNIGRHRSRILCFLCFTLTCMFVKKVVATTYCLSMGLELES